MQAAVSRLYLPIASQKIANMIGSAALPPSSSSTSRPSQPSLAIFWNTSSGNSRLASCSRVYSRPTSFSMK